MSDSTFVVTNQLLCALIEITNQRLLPHLEEVSLTAGQILYESGVEITDVYFPQNARFSLLLVMEDRSTIEVISIGREGLVGLPVILGSNLTNARLVVQMSGKAFKITGNIIKREFEQEGNLRKLLLLYIQIQLKQISQITACRSHHGIEQRLARWLLLIYDNVEGDTLLLTQKFISSMLGVRRASITEIAISFQKQGIIQYSRGQITLLDRFQLESIACECYSTIRSEYKSLLKPICSTKNKNQIK